VATDGSPGQDEVTVTRAVAAEVSFTSRAMAAPMAKEERLPPAAVATRKVTCRVQQVNSHCFPQRRIQRLEWCRQHASTEVWRLIKDGLQSDIPLPQQLPLARQHKSCSELLEVEEVVQEYLSAGAISSVESSETKHLLPWFLITKFSGEGQKKIRMIVDARKINQYFCPNTFRMDNMGTIFPFCRQGWWAAKVDLKHAYFHLPVSDHLKPYLCFQVGQQCYQFQGAPLGGASLLLLWTKIMQTFQKMWHQRGFQSFIYLDDILLLGHSKEELKIFVELVLKSLQDSGMVVNEPKSVLHPTQVVRHLGFVLDLKSEQIKVPPGK